MDKLNYSIKTFGCKVNTYDTSLLQKRFESSGFKLSKTPQVHILNTCAVTEQATLEAIRSVRQIKKKNPESFVVVTGCAAQVDTEKFENLLGADLVVANSHKGELEELIAKKISGELTQRIFKSNIFKKMDLEEGGGSEVSHTRSFIKIQDGCNSFCTYCVIPFARGKSRSLSFEYLENKINEHYDKGVREVVLTGVHIGDFSDDNREYFNRLEDLVEHLLKHTDMPRFRLSSLEPVELSDRLLDFYKNPRMCPHFHMSIQSANTKVLRDMKRNYGAQDVERALTAIEKKLPNAFVGMDVIAGFPAETDEEFEDTFQRLQNLYWTKIHVFPYSSRPGVYSNKIQPQIPQHIIVARSKRLRELSSERFAKAALKQIGLTKEALILNSPSKGGEGLSEDYWPVHFNTKGSQAGELKKVRITGYDHSLESRMEGCLVGALVRP